jgi:hypothetical protein
MTASENVAESPNCFERMPRDDRRPHNDARPSRGLVRTGALADWHLNDLAILASLVTRQDRVGENVTRAEVIRVRSALAIILSRPSLHVAVGVDASTIEVVRDQFFLD